MQDGSFTAMKTFVPDTGNPRAFRDALGRFATGVTVVTIAGADGPMGFTANSFSSLSIAPPLVLWSPARAASRFKAFADARQYAIHVLGREQSDIALRFARGGEGFSGLAHTVNDDGVPILPGALARFDCHRHATHDGGDHLIVVGYVRRAAVRDGKPLVFSQGHYGGIAAGD